MKVLDILFYVLYSTSNKTNKSIPEWSTIIAISILFSFNIFSLFVLFNVNIESIGKKGFQLIPIILIGLNWNLFLKKKRYLKILENYSKQKTILYTIIVILYVILSISFLFIALEMIAYLGLVLISLTVIIIIAQIMGEK